MVQLTLQSSNILNFSEICSGLEAVDNFLKNSVYDDDFKITIPENYMSLSRFKGLLLAVLLLSLSVPSFAHGKLQSSYIVQGETGIPQIPYRVPEGVAFDEVLNRFIATGIFGGKITTINAKTGVESLFYEETINPAISFAGVKVDNLRRIVWACSVDLVTDRTAPIGAVYAFNAHTGSLLKKFPLPFPFFCNDIALDPKGNAYATNSFGDSVAKISPKAITQVDGAATTFATSPLLLPDLAAPIVLGQNGIAVTPNQDYLLVAISVPGKIVRISLTNPADVSFVTFSGDTFGVNPNPNDDPLRFLAADGLQFIGNKLYVSFHGGIQKLVFNKKYTHAFVESSTNVPTGLSTLTSARGQLYAIDSETVPVTQPQLEIPVEMPNKIVKVKFK